MNIKAVLIGIVSLVVGLGGGYFLVSADQSSTVTHDISTTMNGMTNGLENKRGEDFEQAFIDEMIVHHEGAVAMAQMVLQKSKRPELVKLANDIITAQMAEINLMRGWKSEWFGGAAHNPQ